MDDNSFVKIENKKMPLDNYNYPSLDENKNNSSGFINFLFLSSVLSTAVMWFILIFLRK